MNWLDRSLVISPIHYGLCRTEKAFKKELKRLGVPKKDRPDFLLNRSDATVHFFESKDQKECAIVCLGKMKDRTSNEIVGLLIHEAVHIWQHVKENMGESYPSKEFEAYAIQTIAQRLIEEYSR